MQQEFADPFDLSRCPVGGDSVCGDFLMTVVMAPSSPEFTDGIEPPLSAHLIRPFGVIPPDYGELLSLLPPLPCSARALFPRHRVVVAVHISLAASVCLTVVCLLDVVRFFLLQ